MKCLTWNIFFYYIKKRKISLPDGNNSVDDDKQSIDGQQRDGALSVQRYDSSSERCSHQADRWDALAGSAFKRQTRSWFGMLIWLRKCGWIWRRFYAERMTRAREKKRGSVGVRAVMARARRLNWNKWGGVIRESSSVWFHTLRLESSQSITEGLSISCALLVAAQHPKMSHRTQVLVHLLISNIIGKKDRGVFK